MTACPHCRLRHGIDVPYCPDTRRWTTQERDAWREDARRRFPAIRFVGTFERARLLGAANAR